MDKGLTTINTGLDGFILLKGITQFAQERISAWAEFDHATPFLFMEAMAQTGSFHCRYLCDFNRHTFLLKLEQYKVFDKKIFSGRFELQGCLTARTQSAFVHELTVSSGGVKICSGELFFASLDYDHRFQKKKLKDHYKKVFSCLAGLKNA